jgi:uncharacterized protein
VVTLVAAWFVESRTDASGLLLAGAFGAGLLLLVEMNRAISLGVVQFMLTLFAITEGVFFGSVAEGVGVEPLLTAFAIAAAIAFGMAVLGYLNPRDMAGWGPPLVITLLGLLLLLIVSSFIAFEGLDLLWTSLGLALFSAFTAYDVNRIRHRARGAATDYAISRIAIDGAVDVYLDVANLVMEILRFREQ